MTAAPKKKQRVELGDLLNPSRLHRSKVRPPAPTSVKEAEAAISAVAHRLGLPVDEVVAELHTGSALARIARALLGLPDDALTPHLVAFAMVERVLREKVPLKAAYAEASDRIWRERTLGSKTKAWSADTVERYHKRVLARLKALKLSDLYTSRRKSPVRRAPANKRKPCPTVH